jgi:hypothetical protein
MSAEVWIALGGAVVAVIVADVTWRQFQLQRLTAQGDIQDQFNQVIHKLAAIVYLPAPPSGNIGAQMAETQALITQAQGLLRADGGSKEAQSRSWWRRKIFSRQAGKPATPHADSFCCNVLASAFMNAWDVKLAEKYWNHAVARAKGPQALVYALRGRALFSYARSRDDADLRNGKKDFSQALEVLKSRTHGNDLVRQEDAITLVMRAQCELGLGNEDDLVTCIREAWQKVNGILSLWRRNDMINSMTTFAASTYEPGRYSSIPELDRRAQEQLQRYQPMLPIPQVGSGLASNADVSRTADTQLFGSGWPPPPPSPDGTTAAQSTDNAGT